MRNSSAILLSVMRFFRKNPWSIQAVAPSWGNLLSIYDRVREDPSAVLPDEGKVFPGAGSSGSAGQWTEC